MGQYWKMRDGTKISVQPGRLIERHRIRIFGGRKFSGATGIISAAIFNLFCRRKYFSCHQDFMEMPRWKQQQAIWKSGKLEIV